MMNYIRTCQHDPAFILILVHPSHVSQMNDLKGFAHEPKCLRKVQAKEGLNSIAHRTQWARHWMKKLTNMR